MNNVQMGGEQIFTFKLEVYVSYITRTICISAIFWKQDCLRVFPSACGFVSDKKLLSSWAYSFSIGGGNKVFKYFYLVWGF